MYGIILEDEVEITREEFTSKLKKMGVDTREFFIPMNKQPVFLDGKLENAPNCNGDYLIADKVGKRGFYLPSSSNITDEQIELVCYKIKELLNKSI